MFSTHYKIPQQPDQHSLQLLDLLARQAADIIEHKRSEDVLNETKNYLENLINYANAPIIVRDSDFKITRFNHAFERLTGLKTSEVLDGPLDILFPEDSRDESLNYIKRTHTGERWGRDSNLLKSIYGIATHCSPRGSDGVSFNVVKLLVPE
jgi:PAS domain-containing protein